MEKRVIKFRAYDNWSKKMVQPNDGDFIAWRAPLNWKDAYIVMQFTGLYDKHGKEIYEGDILSVCNGSINLRPWMESPFKVEYQLNKGFIMPMYCWGKEGENQMDSTHWCEVIGNIHENPELL